MPLYFVKAHIMVKKIFLSLISLAILSYSSAWAFSGHIDSDSNQVTSINVSQIDVGDNEKSTLNTGFDEHCGHMFAHLLVIFNDYQYVFSSEKMLYVSSTFTPPISLIPKVLTKPPRV